MSLTLNEALSKIGTVGYTDVAGLQRLVSETSAVARNATANALTLLYSGQIGGIPTYQVALDISDRSFDANGKKQVVTIADTDVAGLLEDTRFQDELFKAVGNDLAEYERILNGKDLSSNRISSDSFWDLGSKMLARSVPGDYLTLTPNAVENSVFSQSEFTEILNNPDLSNRQINGTSVEDLRRLQSDLIINGRAGNEAEASRMTLDYVNRQSALQTENLKFQFDSEGKQLTGVGSRDYFQKIGLDSLSVERSGDTLGRSADVLKVPETFAEREALKNFTQTNELVKGYHQERVAAFETVGDLAHAVEASKSLSRANAAGIVMGLMLIGSEAIAAEQAGNHQQAKQIVADGLVEFAKGAAVFGGAQLAATAIGALIGLPLGALVGGFLAVYGAFEAFKLAPALIDSIADLFTSATLATQPIRRDPLVFDLDGDGLETLGLNATNPIYFDHDADGIKTATGWVNADDAFLVLDKNANGVIDDGRELFGDATIKSNGQLAADGFDALRDLDSNADGKIDSSDSQFANLRLWRDLNQDGISQSGELLTLDSQTIAAINVGQTANSQILANGNQLADLGSFIKPALSEVEGSDGSSGTLGEVSGNLGDINLVQDTFHSRFTDIIPLIADAQFLPDVRRILELYRTMDDQVWREAA
jgi:hypothetical protein